MDVPPPYTPSSQGPDRLPEYQKQQPQQSQQLSNTPTTIFPSNFGVYHAPSSFSNLCIATSADASKVSPLFYISTHNGFSSQPDVVLHSQNVESSPPMATAIFHAFSSSIDIHIFLPTGQKISTKVERQGTLHTTSYFAIPVPSGATERFEWKSSRGTEVQSLNGSSYGMKIVRSNNGQVVAAWTGPNAGSRKKGKLAFLGQNGDPRYELGIVFELATAITNMALVERARRHKSSSAAAAGGGGGAAC